MQSLILALVYLPGIRNTTAYSPALRKAGSPKGSRGALGPSIVSKVCKEGSMLCAWLLNPAMLNKTRPVFVGL